jgi:dihydroorotate dehydrogenase (fumarate)
MKKEDRAMLHTAPTIAGVSFPFCLMNAAGALSTSREELLALAHSESGAVVTKSITPESFLDPGVQCGLENPGHAYYVELVPELRRTGKPVLASVAGLTVEEFILVSRALAAAGVDLIEINFNDPHVHTHLAPFASAGRLRQLASTIREAVPTPLAVKLPLAVPLPLTEVAAALLDCGIPAATCHNSSANGGPSQAQVILGASTGRLDVIGVGGVASGVEALSVLRSGIKAIQVGSAVVKEGVGVFARLKREIANSVEFRP